MTTSINKDGSMYTSITLSQIPETDCDYFLIDGVKAVLDSSNENSVVLMLWEPYWNDNEHDINNWTATVIYFSEEGDFDIKAVFED